MASYQSIRLLLGSVFLSAQFLSIVYSQSFADTRYFCWAPNDYMVSYNIQVKVNGRELTPEEVRLRYRLPAKGVYQTMVGNLEELLRQYESTYGRNDHAEVILKYSTNGRPQQEWRWPNI